MEDASAALAKLRPVTFRYKAGPATGPRPIEYGLIAEEVAEIYPELVVRDKDGRPAGVRYHVLPAMLLNELQRQQRVIEAQASRLAEYDERFRDQTRLNDELTARLSRLERRAPPLRDAEQNDDASRSRHRAPRRRIISPEREERSCERLSALGHAHAATSPEKSNSNHEEARAASGCESAATSARHPGDETMS